MTRLGLLVPNAFPGIPSYRLPEETPVPPIGARVAAPFGTRVLTGIVAQLDPPAAPEGTVEREVLAVLDEGPFLPPTLVATLISAAAYYFAPPGELLRAAVPSRLLEAGDAVYAPTDGIVGRAPEDPREALILEALVLFGRATLEELADAAGHRGLGTGLKGLLRAGFIRLLSDDLRAGRSPVERAWLARPAEGPPPRRTKRHDVHARLLALGRAARLPELRELGATPAILKTLEKEGLAVVVEEERRVDLGRHVGTADRDRRFEPTPAQAEAIAAIGEAVASRAERHLLVDGVTGSGKTEVYLAALDAARRAGRRGILLVPEIALAPALVRRVVARFGERVSLLHSGLSDGERAAEWERARRGEVDAVVGPRSAVFAPLPGLGVIVVDEAHEGAYKQAETPRYDARDLARARARREGATLVFGSATPSMELERLARDGKLPRLLLPERPNARERGRVEVVDLRGERSLPGDHGKILFAERTKRILSESFEKGEQAIVLLNRRGFSPSLMCRACGEDFRCRNCSVSRTYHRRHERLVCHYCADVIRRPPACPKCGSEVLMPIGFGTERLEERFAELFPGITHAVLDRDAAARRGGAAGVLQDFESGRAQALLGTQMVAKGHDFPNATSLAVLDADALLSFPDFRAAERTFQLVTQAAGRVGRGDRPGLVAVQTARPDHEAIRAAVAQDHQAFAEAELRFRRAFRYPPFTHLLLALWTDPDVEKAESAAREGAAAVAPSLRGPGMRLLGPAPAPIERLKGLWRFHLLVKSEAREGIAEAGRLLQALPRPPRLDVDPQSLL